MTTPDPTYPLEVHTNATHRGLAGYRPPTVRAYTTTAPGLAAHLALDARQGPWVLTHGPTGSLLAAKLKSLAHARAVALELIRVFNRPGELMNLEALPIKSVRGKISLAKRRAYDSLRQNVRVTTRKLQKGAQNVSRNASQ